MSVESLQVARVRLSASAAALRARLLPVPGITACTVSADAHTVAYTCHPAKTTPAQVKQQLAASFQVREYQPPAAPVVGPQCLMPMGYVTALARLRFAFNLHLFFIKS